MSRSSMTDYPKMKTSKLFYCILLIILALTGGCTRTPKDVVVAKVNQSTISVKDLNQRLKEYQFDPTLNVREINLDFKKNILNELIQEKLIEQISEKLKIKVSDQEVQNIFASIFEVDDYVEKPSDLETESIKRKIYQQTLAAKLFEHIIKEVSPPTDLEIEKYYLEHPEEFLQDDQIRIMQMIVKSEEEAKQFTKDLEKMNFESLGQKYGLHPQNTFIKDTGYISRGVLEEDLEVKFFNLDIGKISAVIQTDQGFHIVKILDKKNEQALHLTDVRDFIFQNLYQQKKEAAYNQWLEEKILQANIERNHGILQ